VLFSALQKKFFCPFLLKINPKRKLFQWKKHLPWERVNNKTSAEKQSFHFNKVFDPFAKQDAVFNYVLENGIRKALEGTNCSIISYGQTGAGKTYTTFGEHEGSQQNSFSLYSDAQKDKKGLVPKTIEYLLTPYEQELSILISFGPYF